MMSIFSCDLCPLTFSTQRELMSHKYNRHITSPSASNYYQSNQGSTIAGSSSVVRGYPLRQNPKKRMRINNSKVFDSALMAGEEVVKAACTLVQISQSTWCMVDYSQQQHHRFETSDGPSNAKKLRGAPKTVLLETAATRRRVFRCDECMREFPSYHALGGHKSGHRKAAAGRSRFSPAQVNQPPPQPQLQEPPPPPPPPPPSPQEPKFLFDLNEPPSEE